VPPPLAGNEKVDNLADTLAQRYSEINKITIRYLVRFQPGKDIRRLGRVALEKKSLAPTSAAVDEQLIEF